MRLIPSHHRDRISSRVFFQVLSVAIFVFLGNLCWHEGEPSCWYARITMSLWLSGLAIFAIAFAIQFSSPRQWKPPLPWWLRPLDWFVLLLMVLFLASLLGSMILLTRVWPGDVSKVELPFSVTGAVLHPDGRIITYSRSGRRIQEYDRDGRFLTGWFVNVAERGVLSLTNEGKIELNTLREYCVFGADRKVSYQNVWARGQTWMADDAITQAEADMIRADGTRVRIDGNVINARVTRIDPDGSEQVVVSLPWYLTGLSFPPYSFAFLFAAGVLHGLVGNLGRSRCVADSAPPHDDVRGESTQRN